MVVGRATRPRAPGRRDPVTDAMLERTGAWSAIGPTQRRLAIVVAFAAIALGVAFATATDRQGIALTIAVSGLALLLASRFPWLALGAFVVLIPVEEAVVVDGFGSLSRYAAILLIVTFAATRLSRLRLGAIPLAGWGYVGWAIFSAAWALAIDPTWTEIPILILLFATTVIIASMIVERPSLVRPMLWAYACSAGVTAAIGVVAYIAGGGPLGPEDRIAAIQDQNPAYYAAILLPALIFTLNELINGRTVVPSAAISFVCTVAIIASGTRGAWVAIAVVFWLFLVPRLNPARRVAAIGVIIVLGAITLQLPGISTLISERADLAVSSGGSGRTDIWSVGLRIFESAPVTGVGLANFPTAFTPERVRETPVVITDPATLTNRAPHNIVIGTLGELGLVGAAMLSLFLGPLVIRRGWGPDATAVQASIAGMLVLALFLDVLNLKVVWLLIAIGCALAYLKRHGPTESWPPARAPDPPRL
jgi:O-antigen ligase